MNLDSWPTIFTNDTADCANCYMAVRHRWLSPSPGARAGSPSDRTLNGQCPSFPQSFHSMHSSFSPNILWNLSNLSSMCAQDLILVFGIVNKVVTPEVVTEYFEQSWHNENHPPAVEKMTSFPHCKVRCKNKSLLFNSMLSSVLELSGMCWWEIYLDLWTLTQI